MKAALGEASIKIKQDKPNADSEKLIAMAETRNVLDWLPAYIAAFYGHGADNFVAEADKPAKKYEQALREFDKLKTKALGAVCGGFNPESNWLTVLKDVVKAIIAKENGQA